MYERLATKDIKPTMEEFMENMGTVQDVFERMEEFLISELKAEKTLKMDAHSRCWKVSYHRKKNYICDIISEKGAFTLVTRLSEDNLKEAYNNVLPYTTASMENSPFCHKGWIEYRVLDIEHLNDAKIILKIRMGIPI